MMRFSVLGSGSKANCVYLESQNISLLIDCGLSCKQTLLRLEAIGINPECIEAVLVTHEHGDHIKGARVLSKKLKIPIYANIKTGQSLQDVYELKNFKTGVPFDLNFKNGSISVKPFSIVHDARDPVGFEVFSNSQKFTYLSDFGKVTGLTKNAVRNADALHIEANYDKDMLQECHYPWEVKQRIASTHGHSSNEDTAKLIRECASPNLQAVTLGHLSENSNCPKKTMKVMAKYVDVASYDYFKCASQHKPTPLITLRSQQLRLVSAMA